jgi:CPA1 family monovalent cation:H+ antiporter
VSAAIVAVELLVLAIIVALITKRLRLPYTIGLVVCGLVVGITRVLPVHVDRDLLLLVLLPPLLFEGALNMDLELLREQWFPVALYAVVGTVLSAGIIGVTVWAAGPLIGLSVPLPVALFLGTILSATDPVSVLAMFKELGVEKRLAVIVEGESVFNDGIAVVLYLVMYGAVSAGGPLPGLGDGLARVVLVAGGGAAVGLAVGWVTYRILRHIDDHLLEVMISVVLAWGSYLLAERVHASGVLAAVCAGLLIGNHGRLFSMSPTTRVTLGAFWEVAAFIVNSFLFILIGLQMDRAAFAHHLPAIVLTTLAMLFSRAAVVHALAPIVRLAGWHIPRSWEHVLNVGGLRGSIPVALALGLPAGLAEREMLLACVFGAVFFSMLAQGLAIKPLLARLGLLGVDEHQRAYERKLAEVVSLKAALREADRLSEAGEVAPPVHAVLTAEIREAHDRLSAELGELQVQHDVLRHTQEIRARRRLLLVRRAAVDDAFRKGLVSEQVVEDVRRDIDGLMAELPH